MKTKLDSDYLIGITHSVKTFWVMTKTHYYSILSFKNANGRYLLEPGIAKPSELLGYEIHLCEEDIPLGLYTARHNGQEWKIYNPEGEHIKVSFYENVDS